MAARIVIENCEPRLGRWLYLEYKHASDLDPELAITNVPDPGMRSRLSRLCEVLEAGVSRAFPGRRLLSLDPAARAPLRTEDFDAFDVVVVGGILGSETPQGRTSERITEPLGIESRHLGTIQLPIDVAVFVAKLVRMGEPLEEIEITSEVEVAHDSSHSTILPYGYPVVDGKVLITPGLVEHIRSGSRTTGCDVRTA